MNRLVFAALLLAACSGGSSGLSSGGDGGGAPVGGGGAGGTGGAACACDCEPTAPSTHPIAYCEDPTHDGDACCLLDGEIGTCSQGACTEWKGCAPRELTAVAWLDFAPE